MLFSFEINPILTRSISISTIEIDNIESARARTHAYTHAKNM